MILPKYLCFQNIKIRWSLPLEFKFLSESDDLSGLIGSISHDDLNSLDDFASLFDLRKAKNASALDTEWFSWPQPPWKPFFCEIDH